MSWKRKLTHQILIKVFFIGTGPNSVETFSKSLHLGQIIIIISQMNMRQTELKLIKKGSR